MNCCLMSGGYFLGICDPTGTLEPGEVFILNKQGELISAWHNTAIQEQLFYHGLIRLVFYELTFGVFILIVNCKTEIVVIV